jgi:hypothetical protein
MEAQSLHAVRSEGLPAEQEHIVSASSRDSLFAKESTYFNVFNTLAGIFTRSVISLSIVFSIISRARERTQSSKNSNDMLFHDSHLKLLGLPTLMFFLIWQKLDYLELMAVGSCLEPDHVSGGTGESF